MTLCLCFVSALLVSGGVALYPIGWDNREVRDCCGTSSHVYRLGIYLLFIQNLLKMKVIVNVDHRYKRKVKIYVLQPKTCPCSQETFFSIKITQKSGRPNTGGWSETKPNNDSLKNVLRTRKYASAMTTVICQNLFSFRHLHYYDQIQISTILYRFW